MDVTIYTSLNFAEILPCTACKSLTITWTETTPLNLTLPNLMYISSYLNIAPSGSNAISYLGFPRLLFVGGSLTVVAGEVRSKISTIFIPQLTFSNSILIGGPRHFGWVCWTRTGVSPELTWQIGDVELSLYNNASLRIAQTLEVAVPNANGNISRLNIGSVSSIGPLTDGCNAIKVSGLGNIGDVLVNSMSFGANKALQLVLQGALLVSMNMSGSLSRFSAYGVRASLESAIYAGIAVDAFGWCCD